MASTANLTDRDRIVLITGAAGGVGSVLVDRFLANGDTVVATDTSAAVLAEWRARRPADAKLVTAAADISEEADCLRLAEVVREEAGRLDVLTRSLAREVGAYGITVNVVTPGLTVTKAVRDHFPPALLAAQRDKRALPRDEVPEDLVGPVFFLASPGSDFISGQTLNVDGGNFMT